MKVASRHCAASPREHTLSHTTTDGAAAVITATLRLAHQKGAEAEEFMHFDFPELPRIGETLRILTGATQAREFKIRHLMWHLKGTSAPTDKGTVDSVMIDCDPA